MKFDPELCAALETLPDADPADPVVMRTEQRKAMKEATGGILATDERVTFMDRFVPARDEEPDVKVRIYRPSRGENLVPAFIYLHGGAFVAGSIDLGHVRALMIAAEVGCVVVSVEYRLAPEHPFPQGLHDCFTTLLWVAANADDLRIDRSRIGIGGESAGGALAAAVTLMARDGGGPAIAFQLLLYPVLDDRLSTTSMGSCTAAPVWDTAKCAVMWRHYLGEQAGTQGEAVSAYAAPARATSLDGLPAAYVSVCEGDPLRDEGVAYALRLLQAGVPVELHLFPGTFHGFDMVGMATTIGRMAITEQLDALRRALCARVESRS